MLPIFSLYRRSDWERIGGYCEDIIAREDWEFWIAMLKDGGRVVRLPEVGLYYRVRPQSKRVSDRALKHHVIDTLNRRHPEFFERELGGPLRYRRSWSRVINFFSKVVVDEKGAMTFLENNSKPGDYVDLRAEIDTLVILDTGMHPLSTATEYPRKPIKATVYRCEPGTKEDPCFTWCPENERGFLATELYNA